MPASPNSLTHGRDLAQGTGQPAERPEAPAEQELAFARTNPALHDSTHRTVQPCPDRRRRRTRHRSAVAVLSALSRIDLVSSSRSGFGSVELSAYRR